MNRTLRRIVRAAAIYDLITTTVFALPFTAPIAFTLLTTLHTTLGFSGVTPDPADVFAVFFANMLGSAVIVWSVYRLVRPSVTAAQLDVLARALYGLAMIGALRAGATPLLWAFLLGELVWLVLQAPAFFRARR